jgi:hypothetical protein
MHAHARKCDHVDAFAETGFGGPIGHPCSNIATSIVDGAGFRCDEHTPKVEPLTDARAEEIELEALIDDIAATKLRPRGRYVRGLGMWLGWGDGDDDPDFDEDDFSPMEFW